MRTSLVPFIVAIGCAVWVPLSCAAEGDVNVVVKNKVPHSSYAIVHLKFGDLAKPEDPPKAIVFPCEKEDLIGFGQNHTQAIPKNQQSLVIVYDTLTKSIVATRTFIITRDQPVIFSVVKNYYHQPIRIVIN